MNHSKGTFTNKRNDDAQQRELDYSADDYISALTAVINAYRSTFRAIVSLFMD